MRNHKGFIRASANQGMAIRVRRYSLIALAALSAGMPACGPAQPAAQPVASAGVLDSAQPSVRPSAAAVAGPKDAVAIKAAARSGADGIRPLSEFRLPPGTPVAKVRVVAASLDGRDLDPADLSLGSDAHGNILFYLAKKAFSDSFAGTATTLTKSIHSSPLFAKKTQQVRTQLLQKHKDQLLADTEVPIPEPDFLKADVRGTDLTRQMVGSLKKDGGKLAKEGIFIDRNLYIVLAVGDQSFAVKQQPALLMLKFTLPGSEIETVVSLFTGATAPDRQLALPALAEQLAHDAAGLFETVPDLAAARAGIEIEEIEEILEFEIGAELARQGTDLREIELDLDLRTLTELVRQHPELAGAAGSDAVDDSGNTLAEILARAQERAGLIEADFTAAGSLPIDDDTLFNPALLEKPLFTGFSYVIQSLATQQQTPVPSQPSATSTALIAPVGPTPAGSVLPAPMVSASICPPSPCAQPSGFAVAYLDTDCPGTP
ncbi:MAG: hypothetical protein ACAI44_15550 [Candidatus Sericytochromatia bacterium]